MAKNDRRRDNKGRYAPNWFKNAAKSMGYAGLDLLKETMPATMDTVDMNKEFAVNLVNSLRQNKNSKKFGNIEQNLSGKALENWNTVKEIKANAISDLKSGRFYNKERASKFADEFGLDGFDENDFSFDVSDDLNDDNFESDDNSVEPKVVVPTVNITSNINKNNPMVQAVQQQTQLIAQNEQTSFKANIAIAETQMGLNKKIADTLYGGMETINSNLSILINFGQEKIGGYIGASLKYYEENIRYMSEISENIKKMQDTIESAYEEEPQSPYESIFSGGGFNGSEYMKLIKKQFGNALDENMLTGSLKAMFLEGDGLQAIAQAPLTFLPKFIIGKLVPDFLTKTLSEFDKSFKSFMPAMLNKIGSWADEPGFDGLSLIKNFIGSVFGIKNSGKISIDTSNYEKGKVPFDGVTRKSIVEVIPGYLSKILSALTGKDELIFDSDKGIFMTKKSMREEYENRLRSAALSQYESLDDFKQRVNAFGLNEDEDKSVKKHIDDLAFNLAKRKKSFNPNVQNGYEDDLMELLSDDNISMQEKDIIRAAFKSLSNAQQMEFAGSGHFNARQALTRELEAMEKSGNMVGTSQANNLFGRDADYLENNPLIKSFTGYFSGSPNTPIKRGSIFAPTDQYGKNNLDYLRSIYRTLLEGIGVFNINPIKDRLGKVNAYENSHDVTNRERLAPEVAGARRELTSEEIAANAERGIQNYGSVFNTPTDIDTLTEIARGYAEKENARLTPSQTGKNKFTKILKFLFGSTDAKKESINNLVTGASSIFSDFFKRLDNSMYKLVFGSTDDENNVSLFDKITLSIQSSLTNMKNFLVKTFFDPIKEGLIGKDGIITKFKESEFYKNLKEKFTKGIDFLTGTKDENGKRSSGGLFSDVANTFRDMKDSTKLFFTGKIIDKDGKERTRDDSVFGEMKSLFSGFKTNMKNYLFGDNASGIKENAKGLLTDAGNYFKQGFQSFADAIFGKKNERESNVDVSKLIGKMKENAPKTVSAGIVGGGLGLVAGAGGFGLLGSLFLGPMSGVVLGVGTSILSRSDKFKNWLFGEEVEDEDGNKSRTGGFINKQTQEFFKKHKSAMIGGAAIGTLKGITGIGFLPSFILGGPITGALFGVASSLLLRSDAFQDMLFGKKDENGKRTGGALSKLSSSFNNNDTAKKLGFASSGAVLGAGTGAALSSFGVLGSFAFGPLSGAILGAGAGIALAADKWKDAIFGKFDKDGNKTEQGIMNKMMAAVTVNVLQPMKVKATEWYYNVQDWFQEKIAEPFIDSMAPIKEELSRFKDNIKNFAKDTLEMLHIPQFFTSIGDGIKSGMSKVVGKIGDFTTKAVESIGKVTGKILEVPVAALKKVSDFFEWKQMRQGIKELRGIIFENIKNSDFYQNIIQPGIDLFKGTVREVTDFTKKMIKGTFKFLGKAALKTLGFVAKGAISVIAAPFVVGGKLVGGTVKGINSVGKFISNKLTGGNYDATDEKDDIVSGNRGFLGSIGDLMKIFAPGSSLRSATANTYYNKDSVRQRIINQATKKGETLSEDEINDRVTDWMSRHHGGAGYNSELNENGETRAEAKARRAQERAEQKAQHAEKIKQLKEKLKYNQEFAKGANYNLLSDEERQVLSFDDFNAIISDDFNRKNKKDLKGVNNLDRELKRTELAANNATMSIEATVQNMSQDVHSILTGGIPTKSSSRISDNLNGEDKVEGLKYDTQGITAAEDKERRLAEGEKKQTQGIFGKIASLLQQGNDENKEHHSIWNSIFSKKGLITAAIIAAIPTLIGLFNKFNLGSTISNTFTNALGTTGEGRTNAEGERQINEKMMDATVRGGAFAVEKGVQFGSKVVQAGAKAITTTKNVISKFTSNTADDAAKAASKTGIITKFTKLLKESADKLLKKCAEKFPKIANSKGWKLVQEAISKVLKSGKLANFTSKITAGLSKLGTAIASGHLLDIAFVSYGLITGSSKSETANLFEVAQEDVDGYMRMVSSMIKGFLNFSWFFVITIANEISVSIGGPDIIKLVAQALYAAFVGNDADKISKLNEAQSSMKDDYIKYTETERGVTYDPDQGVFLNPDGTVADSSKFETFDSYNDRKNGTVVGNVKSWFSNAGENIKTGAKNVLTKTGDWFKKTGNNIKTGAQNALTKTSNWVKNTSNNIKTNVSNFVTGAIEKSKNKAAERFGFDDPSKITIGDQILSELGTIIGNVTGLNADKTAQFMKGLQVKVSNWWDKDAVDEDGNPIIDPITNKPVKANSVHDFFSNTLPGVSTKVSTFMKDTVNSVSKWWNQDAVDENGNPIIDPITNAPVKARKIKNFFSNTLPGISTKISSFMSDTAKSVSKWWNDDAVAC